MEEKSPLETVREQLRRYEHPLLDFSAQENEDGTIELLIERKNKAPGEESYRAPIHPRDIGGDRFVWSFQHYLYDCLHEYMLSLFLHTPQDDEADT